MWRDGERQEGREGRKGDRKGEREERGEGERGEKEIVEERDCDNWPALFTVTTCLTLIYYYFSPFPLHILQ